MTYPNLVIAGAPRCGTSSLFRWLADHPNVCTSAMKETRYLLDADSPLRRRGSYQEAGIAGYAALFQRCAGSLTRQVVMEATPDYLYQATAPRVLSSLETEPRIVFLLRRPSERVYSHFQFARNNMALLSREMTFAQFVDAIRSGSGVLDGLRNLRHAIDYSRYASYLATWAQQFERSRLQVVLLERMKTEPMLFMRTLATGVGLDPAFYETYPYPRVNESAEIRYRWLERARPMLAKMVPNGILKRAARRMHGTLNVRGAAAKPSDEDRAVLRDLDREFAPDNDRLARMFDMDLAEWR